MVVKLKFRKEVIAAYKTKALIDMYLGGSSSSSQVVDRSTLIGGSNSGYSPAEIEKIQKVEALLDMFHLQIR